MSPTMGLALETNREDELLESQYQKGVRHLCDNGLARVPSKYILPLSDRPNSQSGDQNPSNPNLKLPVIDFAELQGCNRSQVIKCLAKACEEYGFFQLTNHGIESNVILEMIDVSRRFFELPFEERSKYMSADMFTPVRYGTSFNQNKDGVFCWRDFLKLSCHPLSDVLPFWPSSPVALRQAAIDYSKQTKFLYLRLMEAILESIGLVEKPAKNKKDESDALKGFEDGSQLIVVNCYPKCPEPDLTLGMPPHSDYGFLTLLLQDEVKGLQIQHQGRWVTVEPMPNSFVVNVGDHLEIFTNGRYKSVLHRVLVNSLKSRISIASLHSLPFNSTVRPSPKLIDEASPRRYKDTDFASFLEYVSSLGLALETSREDELLESQYQKGVRHLCDNGLARVPSKYILPVSDRPNSQSGDQNPSSPNLKLPVIDFAELQGCNRSQVIKCVAKACEEYGFFQLTNHGIESNVILEMIDASRRFFELPFEERSKYMSADMFKPVRCGTSFNQNKDGVFCWRDFLKLSCDPLSDVLPFWPSSPVALRQAAIDYSKQTKFLYLRLMEAILESIGLVDESDALKGFEDGSQLIVVNCYPKCPEPDLTLGMPPHSDYGLLTLLLQDEVKGLQIHHQGSWVTVEPMPNSFVVNVGDHLEIFTNGRYKSVLHRVLVNSSKSRISIASLHSLPFNSTVRPSPKLIDEANPRRYKDTDFASFLEYISSCEPKSKNFLESRKLA
ncbi:hypothetical protein L1049_012451 [Liquidambar formosana]|uniref:Fe2OG dioxygenase domain-containing protein n=1 Tax=Liquidambar formosana TaxID=63359 RepID=A0AAP0N485_LIQFO